METFRAEEANIEKLFSNKLTYEIPNYQRPYSWGLDQVEKFCEDIIHAYENDEEYLLSSIILVELEKNRLYEVIDGQQRLTTISIFLSTISSFLSDENKEDVEGRIFKKGFESRVQRITTDKTKIHIFEQVLKNFDYQEIKKELSKRENKKNKYYINALYFYEYFLELQKSQFDFDGFYDFLMEKVYLIGVYTLNQSKAMRLFEVLNARGLPLKNSDLIKNFLIERIYEKYLPHGDINDAKNEEENFSSRWKYFETKATELNETIEDVFTYFVYYKLSENPKKDLFEEFKNIYNHYYSGDISKALSDIFYFFEVYIGLYEDKSDISVYRKIHSMKHLKEGRFWKTILMSYLISYRNKNLQYKKLVNEIFRFYIMNWLARETVNPYKQLSFNIIRSISEGIFTLPKEKYAKYIDQTFDVSILRSIFEIYFEDRSIYGKVKKELEEDVYYEKWIKPLLIIIEYHLKEDESDRVYDIRDSKITIEHIYPQNGTHRILELDNLIHRLGNLTLLYQGKNSSFSNAPFEEKREKYQTKKITEFQLTNELFHSYITWSVSDLQERHRKLLGYISEILDFEI